jgi:hypothetical protein
MSFCPLQNSDGQKSFVPKFQAGKGTGSAAPGEFPPLSTSGSCSFGVRAGAADASVPSYQTASVGRLGLNEAEPVTEGIGAVETAFAPRLELDRPQEAAFRLRAHAPEAFFKVIDQKVEMVGTRETSHRGTCVQVRNVNKPMRAKPRGEVKA